MRPIKNITGRRQPISLRERVYAQLRKLILSGRVAAGTRLVETDLAHEMGVSRTPVREALHKLNLEDLVRSIPRAGYIVCDMSEDDLEDLFTTRAAIEQLVARCALERMTPEELDRIEKNLDKTDRVLKSGLTKMMVDLDTEFHEIICRASRSKRLYQIAQLLREHMLKFRKSCLHVPEIAQRARDGHYEIFKAIQSKDSKKLNRAMRLHMENTKKDIIEYRRRTKKELL